MPWMGPLGDLAGEQALPLPVLCAVLALHVHSDLSEALSLSVMHDHVSSGHSFPSRTPLF